MNSRSLKRVLDYARKTCSVMVVPQLVLLELKRLYRKEFESVLLNYERSIKDLNKLLLSSKLNNGEVDLQKLTEDYEKHVRESLSDFWLEEPECKDKYLTPAIKRWEEGVKPFSEKGDGFRDVIIWLTVLDYLRPSPHQSAVFISNNTRDFANDAGDDFHPYLKEEVQRLNIQLGYCSSLDDFILQHVVETEFVTEEWLKGNLDWKRLNEKVFAGVEGIHCTHFFDCFDKLLPNERIDSYEVLSSSYQEEVDMFFMNDFIKDKQLGVELHLGGIAAVRFTCMSGRCYDAKLGFGALVGITICDGKIIDYEDHYYEEETRLGLYETEVEEYIEHQKMCFHVPIPESNLDKTSLTGLSLLFLA